MSDLHDPSLRRALDHAPDGEDRPAALTRDAIQKMARHAVVATPFPRTRWWQRGFSSAPLARRQRTPWNAAFATLLVAGIAGLLWRGETIPDARLDGEARPRQDQTALQPAPGTEPSIERESESSAAVQPETPARSAAPTSPYGSSSNRKKSDAQLRGEQVQPSPPMPPPANEQKLAHAEAEADAKSREPAPTLKSAQRTEAPPRKTPTEPPPVSDATAFASGMPSESQSRQADDSGLQAKATESRSDDRRSAKGLSQRPAASRDATQSALGHSMEATQADERKPAFSALASWTQITITPAGGEPLTLTRDTARSLIVALDASAQSMTSQLQSQSQSTAAAEWRLILQRGGAVLATLELAGEQVRWQEGSGAAYIGTPTADVRLLLRTALVELVRTR